MYMKMEQHQIHAGHLVEVDKITWLHASDSARRKTFISPTVMLFERTLHGIHFAFQDRLERSVSCPVR